MTETNLEQEDIQKEAQDIVASQSKIAEQISKLALHGIETTKKGLQNYQWVHDQIILGAIEALDKAIPEQKERALRQVFDGLVDAGSRLANATKLTFEEAKAKSEVFNENEVKQVGEDLVALETLAIETLLKYKKLASTELKQQIENITKHVKIGSADISSSVKDALKAVAQHPVELCSDSASTGLKLSKSITRSLLKTSSDLLSSAADLLDPDKKT